MRDKDALQTRQSGSTPLQVKDNGPPPGNSPKKFVFGHRGGFAAGRAMTDNDWS
jgi:hypothetical protein